MGLAQKFAYDSDGLLAFAMAEGRVFIASAGSETTPLTAVAYDQDHPEITISVPADTTIVPIRVEIQLESFAGTDNEIIVWRTTNAIAAGTSTAMTEGPTSLRSSGGQTSVATARVLHTADVTLTNYIELWRGGQPLADTNPGVFVYEPKYPPYLEGAATLGVQVAATTTQPTFFGKVTYAEIPSGWLS